MTIKLPKALLVCLLFALPLTVQAQEYNYEAIAKRFPNVALNQQEQANAKMQGECLVGLKQLNYRKQNQFDPIAEWSSFRSISLLEQFPPCQVLVMMEVAQKEIRALELDN